MLQIITEICRYTLRKVYIVGRIGGEEFSVILPDTDLLAAPEGLRNAVASRHALVDGERQIGITVSIGMAQLAASGENVGMPLNRADNAPYRAKSSGRNRVVAAE